MKFASFLKAKQRNTQREGRLKAIEDLGFELLDERGWHDGKFWPKRYVLRRGEQRFDNQGEGYRSTNEAYHAAQSLAQRSEPAP